MKRKFHNFLTLQTSIEKLLTSARFELAPSRFLFRPHNKRLNEEGSPSGFVGTGDIRERERNEKVGRKVENGWIRTYGARRLGGWKSEKNLNAEEIQYTLILQYMGTVKTRE